MTLRRPFPAVLLSVLLSAGAGCAQLPASVPPVALGSTQTLAIGGTARYDDGLTVRLEKIEDSRCRQGMQCVWAGELAPLLQLSGGEIGDKPVALRLGTGTAPQKQQGRYRFVLRQATPETATLAVTRQ